MDAAFVYFKRCIFVLVPKTTHVFLSRSSYDTSMTDSEHQTRSAKTEHPYVSEKREGKPYAEWIVAIIIALCALLAFIGYIKAATVVISVTAVLLGVMRLIMRQRSPWKVRSVGFDSFISITLGIGLLITYASIIFLL